MGRHPISPGLDTRLANFIRPGLFPSPKLLSTGKSEPAVDRCLKTGPRTSAKNGQCKWTESLLGRYNEGSIRLERTPSDQSKGFH